MTQIFISHSKEDSESAQQMRIELEAKGYAVWKAPESIAPGSASYPRTIENGIRGSSGIIVVWSASASQSEWVEREILVAQRLLKRIFPVTIDNTELPITLVNIQAIISAPPCEGVISQLPPHLPEPDTDDALTPVLAQLAHDWIRVRKQGIEHAAKLLEREEYREEVLALLEDVARTDLMMTVREKAGAALHAYRRRQAPTDAGEGDSRHIFGVRCAKEHVTYFDKRQVCAASSTFVRNVVRRAGMELDEIYLKCGEPDCDCEMVVRIDCEGYR